MSGRSGYTDDCCDDQIAWINWRGAVTSALRGKRGQAFLRELLAALDSMPEPALISGELEQNGQVCALGAVGARRGVDMSDVDPYDRESIAQLFGIAEAMAAEIMEENDHGFRCHTPRQRWEHMRAWVVRQLKDELR